MEERKTLEDGSVLIKTEEGIYFLQPTGTSFPLLFDDKEAEKLWND